jgi:hypothetical protein
MLSAREGEEAYPVLRRKAMAEEIRHHWRGGLSFMARWVLAGRSGTDRHARLDLGNALSIFLSFRDAARRYSSA